MESLSVKEQSRALHDAVLAHVQRVEKNKPEDQIAEQLGYGSAEHMHNQFRRWGFPDWLVSKEPPELDRPKRQARNLGTQQELPPAGNAVALFQQELIEPLIRAVKSLPGLVEAVHDGSFVGMTVQHVPRRLSRTDVSEDEWRDLCQAQDLDPASEQIPDLRFITTVRQYIGASHVPPQPLVTLIGAYCLAGGDTKALLELLHRNPSEVDVDKLERLLHAKKSVHGEDGLIRKAEQVTTVVRGGKLGRGAPPADISAAEFSIACNITDFREQGLTEDQIYQKLAWTGRTPKELAKLASLRLRPPEH